MPHINEKIDYTADVFIVHNDKVLLRKHDKYHIWLMVGGHIELDEDPNEAAIREVKEEVGLDVKLIDTRILKDAIENQQELIPPMGMNRHKISGTHEHISLYFVATSETDKVIPEQPNDEWRWCRENEIDSLEGIQPGIVFYAKQALKRAREYNSN